MEKIAKNSCKTIADENQFISEAIVAESMVDVTEKDTFRRDLTGDVFGIGSEYGMGCSKLSSSNRIGEPDG